MSGTLTLLDLAGSIALLLWGVHMVQTGIQRAFGAELRRCARRGARRPLAGVAAGLGVTAVLQSSTATGLMISSFAAGGLVDLVPALAAMLGANVGTTLIVQVLSFDVSRVASLAVLVGVMMFRRGSQTRTRDLGRVAIGLGLMLLALHQLLGLITPYEDVPSLRMLLGSVATDPLIGRRRRRRADLGGAFQRRGGAAGDVAGGQGRGAAGCRVRTGAGRQSRHGDQSAAGRCDGRGRRGKAAAAGQPAQPGRSAALLALAGIGCDRTVAGHDRTRPGPRGGRFPYRVQSGHGAAVLPVAAAARRVCCGAGCRRAMQPADPSAPLYLGRAERETPTIALAGAAREALRMADVLDAMLRGAWEVLDGGDRKRLGETRRLDDVLDRLNSAIKILCHRAGRRQPVGRGPPAAVANPGVHDQPGARRRRAGPQRDGARGQAAEARPGVLRWRAGRHWPAPFERLSANLRDGGRRVHDRGHPGRPPARGREGGVPRTRDAGDGRAFRAAARGAGAMRAGGRHAATRPAARPQARQHASGRGRRLPRAGGGRLAAAEPAGGRPARCRGDSVRLTATLSPETTAAAAPQSPPSAPARTSSQSSSPAPGCP